MHLFLRVFEKMYEFRIFSIRGRRQYLPQALSYGRVIRRGSSSSSSPGNSGGGHNAFSHTNIKSLKLMKALFSTVLFGGTLVTALWFRKRKREHLKDIMLECTPLRPNPDYSSKNILYRYKSFVIADAIVKVLPELTSFKVRDDDVYVVSFPKTGTTWVQELVYLIATDLDVGKASTKSLGDRFPYLEFPYPGIHAVEHMESPRFIKTHLPLSLLPTQIHEKKPKIVYVIRNPKDVVVSYYHFARMLTLIGYEGTFKDFFESFLKGEVMYGPIWKHYLEFWSKRNEENILIVFYEDLQKDAANEIRKMAAFLGKSLIDEDVERLAEHCSFREMARNPSVNYSHWDELGIRKTDEAPFMRKGIVGDWKNYLTPDMNLQIEDWIAKHFKDSNLEFIYE